MHQNLNKIKHFTPTNKLWSLLQRDQRADIGQTVGKNIRGLWAGQHFQLIDLAANTAPALKP